MRERKFRGMDANGVMRYGRLHQDKENSTVYYEEYSQRICWDDSNIPVSNESLGEFLGRHDKNEKEIFEGDVVTIGAKLNAVIKYDHCGFVMEWTKENARTKLINAKSEPLFHNCHISTEVIGNIWENPELQNK